jgi:hypothetical protein
MTKKADYARIALAGIRMVNGAVALIAPSVLVRQLGADPKSNATAFYPFRLFGIRTVLIAVDLVKPEGPTRAHAIQMAPLIHAVDTASAALAGIRGQLPPRIAVKLVLLSGINTALAVIAQPNRSASSIEPGS